MTHDEAHALGRGYAWGHSDGAAERVKGSTAAQAGSIRFADAFASAVSLSEANGRQPTGWLPSVQEAFARWQTSDGVTI